VTLHQHGVVTVGSFDGVHRGHLAVLEAIASRARATGRPSVLVTFEPHPREVIEPDRAPLRLTTPDERLEILAQTALDCVVLRRFDHSLRQLSPEAFVEHVLVRQVRVAELIVGENHGFGRGRTGDVGVLRSLGRRLGFTVDVVPPVVDPVAGPISSSRVRAAVAAGNIPLAARLLGRPYTATGVVIPGAGRGRSIGVPTANLALDPRKLLPPDGVWAVWTEWGEGRKGGMANQGPRPTVGDLTRAVEVHVFDVDRELYGRRLRIEWVTRLRDILQFPSLDALAAQLQLDAAAARAALARHEPTHTD
jgi:riboflavin kinase/FMN adenylyltransferase